MLFVIIIIRDGRLRWTDTKPRSKKLVIHVGSHANALSLLESGEQRYRKAINNNNNRLGTTVVPDMLARYPRT